MRSVSLLVAAAAIGFAGMASASHKEGHSPSGGSKGISCDPPQTAEVESFTPGEMFRHVAGLDPENPNPHQQATAHPRIGMVGRYIFVACEPFSPD